MSHATTKQMKAGAAMLTSDKANLRAKTIVWDNKGHILMIKGLIDQEDKAIRNMYASKNRASKYWSPKGKKRQIHNYSQMFRRLSLIDWTTWPPPKKKLVRIQKT